MPAFDHSSSNHAVTVEPLREAPVHTVRRIDLVSRSVSQDHADVSRMVQRGCHVRLPQLDAEAILSVHPAESVPDGWSGQLALANMFGVIELSEGTRILRALSGVDLAGHLETDDETWEWLQSAVIARLDGTPFDRLESIRRGRHSGFADPLVLRITLSTGLHTIISYARADASSWLMFLQQGAWQREQLPVSAYFDVPVDVPIRIAHHTLPRKMLATLAPGDIFIPDSPRFSPDGRGLVSIGGMNLWVGYKAPCSLEVITREDKLDSEEMFAEDMHQDDMHYQETPQEEIPAQDMQSGEERGFMEEQHADMASQDTPQENAVVTDAVPVRVDFLLGRARMLLGDLRTVGEGTIIPFSGGSPASIIIESGGRVLGRGEAVDVNGQLGIRVTQWGPA